MITFRPLFPAEFDAYLALGLAEYAEDLAANYRLSPDRAAAESALGAANDLPQGQATPGQTLFAITAPGLPLIGYLWFHESPDSQSAFINDFSILPAYQNRGHGTAALAALSAHLRAKGITQIRLRVAANNPRAQALYAATGFFPTGTNMAKSL
ncbi:MAG: GNAT family N-acetyltransferase [Paracoccaceae bacterium]